MGPTASGKSALAVRVATQLGDVEIVSMDAMQVYRGLDIGTAKPSPSERACVPHHLIDIADPGEEWSVARFQLAARAAVRDIEARGARALLVGGTGLYVRAVLDDLCFPPEDESVRAALEARTAEPGGLAAAYDELARLDAQAAARIDAGNARRIVRALEVIELTGRPFSSFGPGLDRYGPTVFPVRLIGVWLPRRELARRIDERVGAMFAAGLVEEVRGLIDRPGSPHGATAGAGGLSRTARQAIGYREVLEHLAPGGPSLEETRAMVALRTRSFARRQRMWFRRDPRITWLATGRNADLVAPALLECCRV